jgi:1-acyl-sn-glycerol-3-phosphate acyltransferase
MDHSSKARREESRFLTAPQDVEALWQFARTWLAPLIRSLWPVEVWDRERMPAGPVIVVANHISYLDPIFLGLGLPRAGAFMAMAPVFRWPLLGPLAAWAGAMPVPSPGGSVLEIARRVLEAGHPVILYPEGMRTRQGVWGSVPLRQGAARLAWQTGMPIQPVALIGLEVVLPKGAGWPRFGVPVQVRFGPPIDVCALVGGLEEDEAVERLTAAIEAAIADLLPDHLKTHRERRAA